MGAEHKPPLYAFLVVAVVGALVMVVAARSEAFRQEVRDRVLVAAGAVLERTVGEPDGPTLREPALAEAAESPSSSPERSHDPAPAARERARPSGRGEADGGTRKPGKSGHATPPGQVKGPGPATGLGQQATKPGKGVGQATAPGLVKESGSALGHGQGKSQGKGKGKGKGGRSNQHG